MDENKELDLLRSFFQAWEFMHSIRHEAGPQNLQRMRMELAAQKLVDAANEVQAFKQGDPL